MKRIMLTWAVGVGIILAGAVQTELHQRAHHKLNEKTVSARTIQ